MALPEHNIGPSDVPMSVVIQSMQLLHSYVDSFLWLGICKLSLCSSVQIRPRGCEQLHDHLHGHNRQHCEHLFGDTKNTNQKLAAGNFATGQVCCRCVCTILLLAILNAVTQSALCLATAAFHTCCKQCCSKQGFVPNQSRQA